MKPTEHHPYYYKFMGVNGTAPYGKGHIGPVGEWMPTVSKLKRCVSGYHVLAPEGLLPWVECELYRVEVRGRWIWGSKGKMLVVESYRQLSRVEEWNERTQRLLACEFAQLAVDRYWQDRGSWAQSAIDVARRFANGEATREELCYAREISKSGAYNSARAATSAAWASEQVSWAPGAAAYAVEKTRAARAAAWAAEAVRAAASISRSAGAAYAIARAANSVACAAARADGTTASSISCNKARAELNDLLISFIQNEVTNEI